MGSHLGPPAIPLVVGLLLLAAGVPTPGSAQHEIPWVLDAHTVPETGGYVAWRFLVDSPDGSAPVYLHIGEHLESVARGANYTYLGLWMVNLDYGYVWRATVATLESDGAEASIQTTTPVEREQAAAFPGDWEGLNGGHLPFVNGEWLVVVFWASDGRVESTLRLGSETGEDGPLVTLLSGTSGEEVFLHHNQDFRGALSAHASANVQNTCAAPVCGPARGAHVRVVEDASVPQPVQDRLFGMFSVPGHQTNASWSGPQGGGSGESLYWFHGAVAGVYEFQVNENLEAWPEREPVVAVGADIRIPR